MPQKSKGGRWRNDQARRKHRKKMNETYKFNRRKPTPLGKYQEHTEVQHG